MWQKQLAILLVAHKEANKKLQHSQYATLLCHVLLGILCITEFQHKAGAAIYICHIQLEPEVSHER